MRAQRYTIACLGSQVLSAFTLFSTRIYLFVNTQTPYEQWRGQLSSSSIWRVDQTEAVGLEDEPLPVEASLWAHHLQVWSPTTPEDSQFS